MFTHTFSRSWATPITSLPAQLDHCHHCFHYLTNYCFFCWSCFVLLYLHSTLPAAMHVCTVCCHAFPVKYTTRPQLNGGKQKGKPFGWWIGLPGTPIWPEQTGTCGRAHSYVKSAVLSQHSKSTKCNLEGVKSTLLSHQCGQTFFFTWCTCALWGGD